MAWSGHSTKKQSDKKMKKVAEVAQKWMQKGFSAEQVAEGIWNKVGYVTSGQDGVVKFYGKAKGEKRESVRCEITATSISGPF